MCKGIIFLKVANKASFTSFLIVVNKKAAHGSL